MWLEYVEVGESQMMPIDVFRLHFVARELCAGVVSFCIATSDKSECLFLRTSTNAGDLYES